jgi:hypothetical protein
MTTLMIDIAALAAVAAHFTEDSLVVDLTDGRSISVPLVWYPRLFHCTPAERGNFRFIGRGEGIHWPDLDEDISIEGLVAGRPSSESAHSLNRWLKARPLATDQ